MSIQLNDLGCNDYELQNVFTLITGGLLIACCVFAIFDFLRKWKDECVNGSKDIQPFMVHVTIAANICALLTIFAINFTIVGCALDSKSVVYAATVCFSCTYSATGVLMLFMFYYRLYIIFKGTVYAYSNFLFAILAGVYVVWVCLIILGALSFFVDFVSKPVATFFFVSIYLLFYIQSDVTIILFIRSLFKVCRLIHTGLFVVLWCSWNIFVSCLFRVM